MASDEDRRAILEQQSHGRVDLAELEMARPAVLVQLLRTGQAVHQEQLEHVLQALARDAPRLRVGQVGEGAPDVRFRALHASGAHARQQRAKSRGEAQVALGAEEVQCGRCSTQRRIGQEVREGLGGCVHPFFSPSCP